MSKMQILFSITLFPNIGVFMR